MNFSRMIGASLLGIYACGSAAAAGPPGLMDRPTPPACCADGICYPNATTWGSYPTRWRRWPTEPLAPTPAEAAAEPAPDLRPFETPPQEEEERRAPPPTPTPEAEAPEADGDITRPPTAPPVETPETSPLTPPGGLEPPTRLPFEDDEPTEPQNGLPFGDARPIDDNDPPPRPPFRVPSVVAGPVLRTAEQRAAVPAPAPRPIVPSRPANSDDPPPAFPLTLG